MSTRSPTGDAPFATGARRLSATLLLALPGGLVAGAPGPTANSCAPEPRVVASAPATTGAAGHGDRRAHPIDGPDLDLAVRIGETAVTLEVGFNLAFLDEVLPMARADEYEIAATEAPVVRDRVLAWLRLQAEVRIDGAATLWTLDDFRVDPGDPGLLPLFPNFGGKALVHTRFRLVCAAEHPPGSVGLVWHAFAPDLRTLAANTTDSGVADPGATGRGATSGRATFLPLPVQVSAGSDHRVIDLRPDEPEFTWHAPPAGLGARLLPVPRPAGAPRLALPVLALAILTGLALLSWVTGRGRRTATASTRLRLGPVWLLGLGAAGALWARPRLSVTLPWRAGPTLPTTEQAVAIFAPLHANLYRAFDQDTLTAVYDALAASVEGSLLDTVYQDVYRSLVLQEEGGAVGRVAAVRPLATTVESIGVLDDGATPSFTVDAAWLVDASVSHWGHTHARTSALRARYTVVATDLGWRIAGAEPMQQERRPPGGVPSAEGRR